MILPAILLATAQASATATAPRPPVVKLVTPAQPHGSTQSLFSPDDYPYGAPKAGQHASVSMMLKVDEQGRVTDCSILRSSGFAVLDAASCSIMRRRARFNPSRDASGTPVAGFIAQSVDWEAVFQRWRDPSQTH